MQSSSQNPDKIPQDAAAPPPVLGEFTRRHTTMIAFAVIGIATTGYFIGLKSPMTANNDRPSPAATAMHAGPHPQGPDAVIPATDYADMPFVRKHPGEERTTQLASLRQETVDSSTKIEISETDKLASLARREARRAFNGAPPTVPHSIDQLGADACMACHGEGLRSETLRAGKMSHPFLANCTQCHVEQQAKFATASATFENSFSGASAPTRGWRAYPGAPPVIPHSTWMRDKCLSCHGRTASPGMATTHPWRANCLQCHAESSSLNQTKLDGVPQFLPPISTTDRNE